MFDSVVINVFLLMQFERTLIVADEDSQVSYLEGCTAPSYDKNQVTSIPDLLRCFSTLCPLCILCNEGGFPIHLVASVALLEIHWVLVHSLPELDDFGILCSDNTLASETKACKFCQATCYLTNVNPCCSCDSRTVT